MRTESSTDWSEGGGLVSGGRRFLIAYATRYGSTGEVAEALAEQVRDAGYDVDVRSVDEQPDPDRYDAIVIGGPMIRGWHKSALGYLTSHREQLTGRPLAFFITAASLTDVGQEEVDGVPIVVDPWLAKPPRSAAKLRYKERYALPSHYLGDILDSAQPVRPRVTAFFAGSLDLTAMSFLDKMFVLLVVGAAPGDGRNWKAIAEWGAELPDLLLG